MIAESPIFNGERSLLLENDSVLRIVKFGRNGLAKIEAEVF